MDFGPTCHSPVTFDPPAPNLRSHALTGRVVSVDHYGNVITNLLASSWLGQTRVDQAVTLRIHEQATHSALRVETYGQAEPGQIVCLVGSHGYLEIACVQGNAAEQLQLRSGSHIAIDLGG